MDPDTLLNVGLVLLFVLVGGVFAGTEMAIVNLRESQLRRMEASGERGRRTAALARDPNLFLSALQIGVTVAGFFSSAYGASALAPELAPLLVSWGVPGPTAGTLSLVVMTLLIAYLSLVFGELVPKRLGMQRAQRVARLAAPLLDGFAKLMKPVIWLLSSSTNLVIRLLGADPSASTQSVSAEEVRALLSSASDIPEPDRRILSDVFDAAQRTVSEVMRPRTEAVFLRADRTLEETLRTVSGLPYSRYPVCGNDFDDVVGFVHLRDLLRARSAGGSTVRDAVRPVIPFPGSVGVLQALNRMRSEGQQFAVVVDEYGGTDGIVTLEDLLEEIVGEIYDEYDGVARPAGSHRHRPGGPVDVDGWLIVQELPEVAGVAVPDDGSYETVGGFVLSALGRVPAVGDVVEGPGYRLEVLKVDRRRVMRVRVSPAGRAAS